MDFRYPYQRTSSFAPRAPVFRVQAVVWNRNAIPSSPTPSTGLEIYGRLQQSGLWPKSCQLGLGKKLWIILKVMAIMCNRFCKSSTGRLQSHPSDLSKVKFRLLLSFRRFLRWVANSATTSACVFSNLFSSAVLFDLLSSFFISPCYQTINQLGLKNISGTFSECIWIFSYMYFLPPFRMRFVPN